jgi:hypothetical protein
VELCCSWAAEETRKASCGWANLLIYTAWNLWKEMNRRIFGGVFAAPARVVELIKEEMKLRLLACGGDELLSVS